MAIPTLSQRLILSVATPIATPIAVPAQTPMAIQNLFCCFPFFILLAFLYNFLV